LLTDLVWCYKIAFGLVRVNTSEFFELSSTTFTRGHVSVSRRYSYKIHLAKIMCDFFIDEQINGDDDDDDDEDYVHRVAHSVVPVVCLYV